MLNKMKIGLLSALVFTMLMFSNFLYASDWRIGCKSDEITGKVLGYVASKRAMVNVGNIESTIVYTATKNNLLDKIKPDIYLHFSYLNLQSPGPYMHPKILYKPFNKPVTQYFLITDNRLYFEPKKRAMRFISTNDELTVKLHYYKRGAVVFRYNLTGIVPAIDEMLNTCEFN